MNTSFDNNAPSSTTPPLWQAAYEQYGLRNNLDELEGKQNLIDLLQPKIDQYSDSVAFSMGAATLTFGQLDIASRRFAAFLQAQGINKGDRIAVQLPNILQYAVVLLGCMRAGAVLVNVNPMYTHYELAHQLTDAQACGLIVLDGMSSAYEQLDDAVKAQLKWVVRCSIDPNAAISDNDIALLSQIGAHKTPSTNESDSVSESVTDNEPSSQEDIAPENITFARIMQSQREQDFKAVTIEREDLALLQYTGGTTGKPKGAMLTHYNVMANVCQCYAMFGSAIEAGRSEQIKILNPLPLYHIFSFTVCGMYGLYRGCIGLLVPNPRDGASLIKAYKDYPPAFFPAVNTLFNALANSDAFKALDHSKLEMSMGGGMAVLKDTAAKWEKITGNIIVQGYGLSETSPVASANPQGTGEFSGNIGLPMPGTDMAILDEEGNEVPLGERGEICVRGPQVMKGYWKRDDATAEVMTSDGYFRTGDIGVMDEEGYFKIVDRKKNMILVSGFNVYPNEVEDVMSGHPKILECGVIGVDDEKSGEVPKIYVVRSDDSLTKEDVLAYSKENLTGYKRPRYVEFIDELPKSNVGKILHKDLRALEEKNHG